MDIPFNVTFYSNNSDGENFNKFSDSFEKAINQLDEFCYVCKELHDLRVKFESENSRAEFWLEVMDMFPAQVFRETESNYFLPSNDIRGIYLNSSSPLNEQKNDYSFLLPGVYKIIVSLDTGVKYYSFLKVEPLRVTNIQLDLMRNEIENTLNGLAKEIATKRNAMVNITDNSENNILQKYNLLISKSENLIINLNLIIKEPKYKIIKKYNTKTLGKPVKTDLKTIMYKQRTNKNFMRVHSFDYILDYDLSVNRNLKAILEGILKEVILVQNYILETIKAVSAEKLTQEKYNSSTREYQLRLEKLKEHFNIIQQIKVNILYTLKSEWLKNIKPEFLNQDKIHRVPYYRTLHSLYRQLKENNIFNINPFENYVYYWKETPKLYEIWGFIKLLMMLKESSLNITNFDGWIFNTSVNVIYPLLTPNTKITMQNSEGLRLVLIYDSFIPNPNEETSIDIPLVTFENSNRPDFRMDIYYKEMFKGSVLADFKYRSLNKLGRPNLYINHNSTDPGYKVYSQLVDYSSAKSFYLNTMTKATYLDYNAVKRVFGIFPVMGEGPFIKDITKVIRCSLSPGIEYKKIQNEFIDIINEAIST